MDLTGQRYGRLVVVAPAGRVSNSTLWECRCQCGQGKVVRGSHLRAGAVRSCGCLARESVRAARTHGHARHGIRTGEYRSWTAVKTRCTNPHAENYAHYGGRGITMCAEWAESFETFLADMGPRPSPMHTLDRIDRNGPYSPGNCRWATKVQQANNTAGNRHVIIDGFMLTLAEAARRYAIDPNCFRKAARPGRGVFVYRGLTVEAA